MHVSLLDASCDVDPFADLSHDPDIAPVLLVLVVVVVVVVLVIIVVA